MPIDVINSIGQEKVTSIPTTNGGYGTSLPSSPTDGMEYTLVDSTTAPTYQWRLRYNASNASSYKWEFVGGSDAVVRVETSEVVNNTGYIDLSTAGPSFTVPRAGIYTVTWGANVLGNSGSGMYAAVKIGSAATSDAESVFGVPSGGINSSFSLSGTKQLTCAASDVLKLQYRQDTANANNAQRRFISVTPVRVS